MKEQFKVEKVSNTIMISYKDSDIVVKAWDIEEFTTRKLQNAVKKLQKNFKEEIDVAIDFDVVILIKELQYNLK